MLAVRRRRMGSRASMAAGSSISIVCSMLDLPTKRKTSTPRSLRTWLRSRVVSPNEPFSSV